MPDTAEPLSPLDRVLWSDMQPQPAPGQLPLLAHYTSIGTLERISQTGEIWFSNPLYMNDVDELRYGMNLGLHAVRSHAGLREACPPDHYNALLDAFDLLYTTFDNDSAFDVYVFSCSEHDEEIGDDGLLSMWRGYGGDGNGVAIVFDMAPLVAAGTPLLVRQVQYLSYEASEAWMDAKLQQFSLQLQRVGGPVASMKDAAAALFERIKLFALFTKHRGFHEEREWRIVYLRELDRDGLFTQQLHYAIGGRGIEPRLRFTTGAFAAEAARKPLLESMVQRIILGPVLATPLALRSVQRMLELYQPAWADRVARSSTPYRAQRP
ncbi:DUF2971 domain-containing protein [Ramlibacter pallidus]|uniref:DUF2971 domain-containing protein n=1 Tax=Ramlibacter pallidus TaxID=2780087 RepID=A0ABR9S7V3_9BURK|nr:DUF2971 domain-containing protein [Ramlibacter pallidus]MBE7369612.1 DUF2971 domain-containing protein [Ramlibacter pallidus]